MKTFLIVGSPVVIILLLMAYVPGLNTSVWFLLLGLVAIYGGLVFALTRASKDQSRNRDH